LIIKCSNCGARYRIGDDLVANGPKRFKCKSCGTVLLVKPPEAANAPVLDEQPTASVPPSETPKSPQQQQQETAESGSPAATAEKTVDTSITNQSDTDKQENSETEPTVESEQAVDQQDEDSELSPEELAAQQQLVMQEKLEERRRQMEDEISGRLNKAALETLDFEVLSELAEQIQNIQHNHEFKLEEDSKLFSCIKCKTTYCLFPDDSRLCANCTGEVSLVRADDILKQYGMFG
jgi:predicted Zn finger-like uncharacterized protein